MKSCKADPNIKSVLKLKTVNIFLIPHHFYNIDTYDYSKIIMWQLDFLFRVLWYQLSGLPLIMAIF